MSYKFEWNQYVLGDAFPGLAQIPDSSVDLVFTSMPDLSQTEFGKNQIDLYQGFQKKACEEISRITKPEGFIVLCQTDRKVNGGILANHVHYFNCMNVLGWDLKDEKIVVRNKVGQRSLYHLSYQYYGAFSKKGTFKRAGEYLRDIIVDTQEETVPGQSTWSQDFCQLVIETLCPAGGTVVDPFAAAGPVLFAAKNLGRRWWGAELVPERYNPEFSLFKPSLV